MRLKLVFGALVFIPRDPVPMRMKPSAVRTFSARPANQDPSCGSLPSAQGTKG